MAHPYWPFFDLRIATPRLELRPGTDADLAELASITGDIHDDEEMPFSTPWSRLRSPERERGTLQYHWRTRADLKPEKWELNFVVFHERKVIGSQGLMTENFALVRSAETGSWLARPFQGKGLGKEMRAAVLYFLFENLKAEQATTGAYTWNEASIGVTKSLGYEPNGLSKFVVEGIAQPHIDYRLTRERWEEHTKRYVDVQVEGAEACLPLLGADAPTVEGHGSDQTLS